MVGARKNGMSDNQVSKPCHYGVARRACVLASMMLMHERFWYYVALFSLRAIESERKRVFYG